MKISRKDIFKPALVEAIQKVLQDPSYAAAAANVSRKLRARKRTPVQEAAGTPLHVQIAQQPSAYSSSTFQLATKGAAHLPSLHSQVCSYMHICKLPSTWRSGKAGDSSKGTYIECCDT